MCALHLNRHVRLLLLLTLIAAAVVSAGAGGCRADVSAARPPFWVTGYYLSDDTDKGRYPVSKIDFSAVTDIIDFCNFPGPAGTLDPARTIPPLESQEILVPAHAAGVKVLVSLGTDDGLVNIRPDIGDQYRAKFVATLVNFVISRGYDGLDLDYEPIVDSDVPNFTLFVQALRAALDAAKPGLLLTVAAADQPEMYAKIQGCFDQINLMTYSMSGPWSDYKSWYDSPLYPDPYDRMENYQPYPSIDSMVQDYINKGVSRSKLAIGVSFGGVVWTGVDGPRESIKGRTDVTANDGSDYRDIMNTYYTKSRYRWDPICRQSYLSIKGKSRAGDNLCPVCRCADCGRAGRLCPQQRAWRCDDLGDGSRLLSVHAHR